MEPVSVVSVLGTLAGIYNMGAGFFKQKTGTNIGRVKMPENHALLSTKGNIVRLIKNLIVEPNIIVSRNAYDSKVLDNVNGLVLDIFTSFYIQAFYILTKLHNKSSLDAIELLSTKRFKGSDAVMNAIRTGPSTFSNLKTATTTVASGVSTVLNTLSVLNDIDLNKADIFLNKEDIETLNLEKSLNDNMSVISKDTLIGTLIRDFELTINGVVENPIKDSNGNAQVDGNGNPITEATNLTTKVPIVVKGSVHIALIEAILTALDNKGYKTSLSYRWMEYKSGGISLSDFIFCTDLIKEYKRTKLSKYSDVLNKIESNSVSANIQGYIKNVKGFEASYNMVVLTQDDVYVINKLIKAKGGLESYNGMQEFMTAMGAHSVTILNDDTERAKIYISELNGNMDIGYNRLFKRKDNDNNVMDMFKAIVSNTIPRF